MTSRSCASFNSGRLTLALTATMTAATLSGETPSLYDCAARWISERAVSSRSAESTASATAVTIRDTTASWMRNGKPGMEMRSQIAIEMSSSCVAVNVSASFDSAAHSAAVFAHTATGTAAASDSANADR